MTRKTPSPLHARLQSLPPERLRGMRRGLEKESLRAQPSGALALTPHPAALGSALTHPHITTDFSESQVELVTGVHTSVEACLAELTEVHQATCLALAEAGDEMLWVSSMPCGLPTDETIPIGRYGSSNVGRAKSVYRMGLGHRYGRRMQTISGIHYNWSMPGVDSEAYFGLIRNFRRHAFLLLYLLGASPAVCTSFVAGRPHGLQPLGERTMHMPYGTSLRMGRLGYQSDAQASLAVSYNSLDGYAASLHDALTRPYPPYQAIGVRNPGGDYNQLATTLLQIENEFYGTIRPKRVIFPGERPLHALRERGVEYVEVRLLDLDPFVPIGITAPTLRLLDVFLLHCLLSDSPPDSPQEIEELAHNQHRTAERGREPGLCLLRRGQEVRLTEWGAELLDGLAQVARAVDVAHGEGAGAAGSHAEAVAAAQVALHEPARVPSARVLAQLPAHGDSFIQFALARSEATRADIAALPFSAGQRARYAALAERSRVDQQAIEAADTMPFEIYRELYTSPHRLGVSAKKRQNL